MENPCTDRLCCPDAVWLRRIQRAGTHTHPHTGSHCSAHTGIWMISVVTLPWVTNWVAL